MQCDVRYHLTNNTAHILTPLYLATVDTAGKIPVLPSRNAAYIIAHMGISHGSGIGAALDHAGGISGNATGIGGHGILRDLLSFQNAVKSVLQIFQIGFGNIPFTDGSIDCRSIFTAQQSTVVLPHNSAGILRSAHGAGGGTAG